MIELVTIEQARAYVQIVGEDQDPKLLQMIRGASAMVMDFLKLDDSAYLNSDGTMDVDSETGGYFEVPDRVQSSVLYLVGILFRDPDGVEMEKWRPGWLPAPVVSMLNSLRTPTLG